MSNLENLLLKWQDQDLTQSEYEILVTTLGSPEARAELADSFLLDNSLRETFAQIRAEMKVESIHATVRTVTPRPSSVRTVTPRPASVRAVTPRPASIRAMHSTRTRPPRSNVGLVVGIVGSLAAAATVLIVLASQSGAPRGNKTEVAKSPPSNSVDPTKLLPRTRFVRKTSPERPRFDIPEKVAVSGPDRPTIPDTPVTIPEMDSVEQPGANESQPTTPSRVHVAYVDTTEGQVEIARSDPGAWVPARGGVPVYSGDRIRTKYSRAKVMFESGSTVLMNRFTTLTFNQNKGIGGLNMVGGEAYISVVEKDKGFSVRTRHGKTIDLGTEFDVEAKDNRTTVIVTKGSVLSATDEGHAEVNEGHEVTLLSQSAPPGRVTKARDLKRRLAWTMPFENRAKPLIARPPADGRPAVVSFTLIDADTGRPIPGLALMPDNLTIDVAKLPTKRVTVIANTIPIRVPRVEFYDGKHRNLEKVFPATYKGDKGVFHPMDLTPRKLFIEATPDAKASGKLEGQSLRINLEIVDSSR